MRAIQRALADPGWRLAMRQGRAVPTQDLPERLIAAGLKGMVVRSFARSADAGALNVVLWAWEAASLRLVDDEGRLGP